MSSNTYKELNWLLHLRTLMPNPSLNRSSNLRMTWRNHQYSTSAEMKLASIGYQAKQHC